MQARGGGVRSRRVAGSFLSGAVQGQGAAPLDQGGAAAGPRAGRGGVGWA